MRLIDADTLWKKLDELEQSGAGLRGIGLEPLIAIKDAKTIVEDAPTIVTDMDIHNNDWTRVKDKPPKIGNTVLFTGLSNFGTRFIPQRGWFDGTFWKRDTGETVYSSTPVTHWMPLPSTEGLDAAD